MSNIILVIVLAYLIGSIPSGYILVKLVTGKDVRKIQSGRTGGTNVMRAAGWVAGATAASLDVVKGIASGWIAAWLSPGWHWLKVAAALIVIIGHNYSIFLAERTHSRKLHLRGGAGGAACLGGAIALWTGNWIIAPLSLLVFFFVGYASVTTMSIAGFTILISTLRFFYTGAPWEYILYGIFAEAILMYALSPNIKRLLNGQERVVGLRAYRLKRMSQQFNPKP